MDCQKSTVEKVINTIKSADETISAEELVDVRNLIMQTMDDLPTRSCMSIKKFNLFDLFLKGRHFQLAILLAENKVTIQQVLKQVSDITQGYSEYKTIATFKWLAKYGFLGFLGDDKLWTYIVKIACSVKLASEIIPIFIKLNWDITTGLLAAIHENTSNPFEILAKSCPSKITRDIIHEVTFSGNTRISISCRKYGKYKPFYLLGGSELNLNLN